MIPGELSFPGIFGISAILLYSAWKVEAFNMEIVRRYLDLGVSVHMHSDSAIRLLIDDLPDSGVGCIKAGLAIPGLLLWLFS